MKTIYTHPDNMDLIRNLFEEDSRKQQEVLGDHLHFIRAYDFEIIPNSNIEKETWNGKWEVIGNKYFQYWDGVGEPPSWCIYFGFVRKVMEPNFYIIDNLFLRYGDWNSTKFINF